MIISSCPSYKRETIISCGVCLKTIRTEVEHVRCSGSSHSVVRNIYYDELCSHCNQVNNLRLAAGLEPYVLDKPPSISF